MPICKTEDCGAEIVWARTVPGGSPMPIDKGSAGKPEGRWAVWRANGKLLCRYLKDGDELKRGEHRGVSHWGTCTKADEHRKREGWHHSVKSRRWEYTSEGGEVQAFIHDERLAEVDWPDVLAQLEAHHPEIPPLPEEARPKPPPAADQGVLL